MDAKEQARAKIPAQPAPKRGLSSTALIEKVMKVRLKAVGKTDEEIAMIMGVSQRSVRRSIDYLKHLFGVFEITHLIHAMHTHGLIYTCKHEAKDWIDNHFKRAA